MAVCYVLYNLKAGHLTKEEDFDKVKSFLNDFEQVSKKNVMDIEDYADFFAGINKEDTIILCGGDGTLNKFINRTDGLTILNEIMYFPFGTGNDFATDMGKQRGDAPFSIKDLIKDLPTVEVKGNKYRFINGIGFGIDGYCCQVGDELKKNSTKPVNYASIAIKGLLFHYKPTRARVTVDGNEYQYKNVWLAPTMLGKYYGGGMMPAPEQERTNGHLSVMLWTCAEKLTTLVIFPSIFKGTHAKHKKRIHIHTGKNITVEFDRPVALQIDGETVVDVTKYNAYL